MNLRARLDAVGLSRMGRFGVVGIIGALVYYLALWLLVEGLGVGVLTATSLAFALVTVENYLLHYHWSLRSSQEHAVAFPRFVFMSIVGFCINWAIMFVGVRTMIAHYLVVQTVAIAVVATWNYLLSSLWIFATGTVKR